MPFMKINEGVFASQGSISTKPLLTTEISLLGERNEASIMAVQRIETEPSLPRKPVKSIQMYKRNSHQKPNKHREKSIKYSP